MPDEPASSIGWTRASLTALLVACASFALLVVAPNIVLTKFDALARTAREVLATGWFFAALIGIVWGLRRLQARGVL